MQGIVSSPYLIDFDGAVDEYVEVETREEAHDAYTTQW